jgi:hypothetical protein
MFRPRSLCLLFHSFLRDSQRAVTSHHFPYTYVVETRVHTGCHVFGNQGLIAIISKILEQYLNKIWG